jgi:hypothetical protein
MSGYRKLVRDTSANMLFWKCVDAAADLMTGSPSWHRAGVTINPDSYDTYERKAADDEEGT